MIDHTGIGVADVTRSAAFYDDALGALGLRRVMELPENEGTDAVGYGVEYPVFWIDRFHPHGVKQHTAFAAESRSQVEAFYDAALSAGGIDNGAPGLREVANGYPRGYYAAFVLDPEGNNVEAIFRESSGTAWRADRSYGRGPARHIGIVAVSAEGAALCYRTLCAEGAAILGPHDHPRVTMDTIPLAAYMEHVEAGRWDEAGRLLSSSAGVLARAGAELLVCPDNTLHQALDRVRERAPARWLHIAEEVAEVAAARGFGRVGVLGTRYLMEGPVYRDKLGARGIGQEIPEARDRERINAIIFDELVYGRLEEASRRYFVSVIQTLRERGCDAVVLGCTEIPLLVTEQESPLPALDSTRTLARAALREATRDRSPAPPEPETAERKPADDRKR